MLRSRSVAESKHEHPLVRISNPREYMMYTGEACSTTSSSTTSSNAQY